MKLIYKYILMITTIIITVYSRDLGYKDTMMMESMMKLPDDMFKQELLHYFNSV